MTADYKDILVCASQIIPDRLYFVTVKRPIQPKHTANTFYFSTDSELVYSNFYHDFGPLNLAQLYRFCQKLNSYLETESGTAKRRKVVYHTVVERKLRANAAFLIGSYAIIYLGKSVAEAYDLIGGTDSAQPSFALFRDASLGPAVHTLSLYVCLQAVSNAVSAGFFDFADFDADEYERHEQVLYGDFNWLVPQKFLALSGPHDGDTDNGYSMHSPSFYLPYFKSHEVRAVVRLNKKAYDAKVFTDAGIWHKDLFFADGSTPPDRIVDQFLAFCDAVEADDSVAGSAVAVHCKAGLGRTGCLIACYIMRRWKWTADQTIAWLRICRPGSVIGHQQTWLASKQSHLWSLEPPTSAPDKCPYPVYSRKWSIAHRSRASNADGADLKSGRQKSNLGHTVADGPSAGGENSSVPSITSQVKSISLVGSPDERQVSDQSKTASPAETQGDKLNKIKMKRNTATSTLGTGSQHGRLGAQKVVAKAEEILMSSPAIVASSVMRDQGLAKKSGVRIGLHPVKLALDGGAVKSGSHLIDGTDRSATKSTSNCRRPAILTRKLATSSVGLATSPATVKRTDVESANRMKLRSSTKKLTSVDSSQTLASKSVTNMRL